MGGSTIMTALHAHRLVLFFTLAGALHAQTDVLTGNYDNDRTNSNPHETLLNTNNVNPTQFGKLYILPVDGQVYAQPLYVHALNVPGKGRRNVLYAATMHNSVYAFDADTAGAAPLWQVNLGASVDPALIVPPALQPYNDILQEIGILSTPVIDRQGNTIYVVNDTVVSGKPAFFLHALDLATGSEKLNGPVEIQGSVPGTGWGGAMDAANGQLPFRPQDHIQRPGLLLANGSIYVAFGSHGDDAPWHGWIIAYNAADLPQQTAIFCTTASRAGAAIWQGGRGLAGDENGVYVSTGNGNYDGANAWGESVLHLTPALSVADWFTPAEYDGWTQNDTDFGSNGPILVPGTNLLIAGGKAGLVALVDRTNMGHELANNTEVLQIFQAVPTGQAQNPMAIFNAALWNRPDGPLLYYWGSRDSVRAYRLASGTFDPTPAATNSAAHSAQPFSGLAVSSNAFVPGSGILWATSVSSGTLPAPGALHAFDAMDVSRELWNSDMQDARDKLGNFTKFANPTVAGGKVFVPTDSKQVAVYGLLQVPGIAAVVNAASYTSGTIAPGELITIFGNGIGPSPPLGPRLDTGGNVATALGGTTVSFDGSAAPLLYVSASQINAVVPFSVAGKSSTVVRVSMLGADQLPAIYSVTEPVSDSAPAMFTTDSSGHGAVLNGDYSVNTPLRPAQRGSYVSIYATGGGVLDPPVPDGSLVYGDSLPLLPAPVTVTIGGQPAVVSYQGAAPGLVAGVLQINAQVPAGIAPGSAVPVTLAVGSTPGLNSVTIAVQ